MLTETPIVADAGFWPAVADAAMRMSQQAGAGSAADLRGLDAVIPAWTHASHLRAALHARLGTAGHKRSMPPRIHTVATWAGESADDTVERRIEFFAALRTSAWIRSVFGEQPAALWNLASQIAVVCDELTLVALDGAGAFQVQLQACLARHFSRRAERAVQPLAQLVLQLWRASLAQGSATARQLASLQARGRAATRPVLFVSIRAIPGWTRAWLNLLAERVPVQILQADLARALVRRPLLAAAWPELRGAAIDATPIAERAQALDMVSAAEGPTLIEARSLEDEALAVAERVLTWLRSADRPAGGSIALVALDRIAARRVRALLERAQVLVRDETGWKLSTTSAAGVVMRLFDLAVNGFLHRDLLDWIKSPFAFFHMPGKAWIAQAIERTMRDHAPAQGLRGLRAALADREQQALDPSDVARVESWLRDLESHAGRLSAGSAPAAVFARTLDAALGALGMRDGLAADPIGREVLRELDALHGLLARSPALGAVRLSPAEFRALVAARFEEISSAGAPVDSPVLMVSLSGAAMRDFDAAVLIGADAGHLPSLPPELLFLSSAVRADLGLPGRTEALLEQLGDLAAVLIRTPEACVTWRSKEGDEPRALANWLTRLRAVASAAGADPVRLDESGLLDVTATGTPRPAPTASHRLPEKISSSQYQMLVDCPYQFYARSMLCLRPLEEITDEPNPADFGRAVHDVLAKFHSQWSGQDLTKVAPDDLAASLAAHASAVLDPLVERRPRLFALRSQFVETQAAYLVWLHERLAQGWTFRAAEHEVRAALEYEVEGEARKIDLIGRLDRIDARADEIQVLDYKTTRREKLVERLRAAGEHIQLPFYGLLLTPRPTAAAFVYMYRTSNERLAPVGVLAPDQAYSPLVDAVAERLRSDLGRIAGGAPLPALGNDQVCGYCKMRGLCRRDFWQDEDGAS